jgi:hypothetical protein
MDEAEFNIDREKYKQLEMKMVRLQAKQRALLA